VPGVYVRPLAAGFVGVCVCVYMDSAVCLVFLLVVAMGHFDESDSQFTSTRALGAQVSDVTLRDAHCLV
jgi:hypothetical protein